MLMVENSPSHASIGHIVGKRVQPHVFYFVGVLELETKDIVPKYLGHGSWVPVNRLGAQSQHCLH